jgi:hypothetical protein
VRGLAVLFSIRASSQALFAPPRAIEDDGCTKLWLSGSPGVPAGWKEAVRGLRGSCWDGSAGARGLGELIKSCQVLAESLLLLPDAERK